MKLRILRNSDSREDVPIDRLGVACLDNLRLVVRRTAEEAGKGEHEAVMDLHNKWKTVSLKYDIHFTVPFFQTLKSP